MEGLSMKDSKTKRLWLLGAAVLVLLAAGIFVWHLVDIESAGKTANAQVAPKTGRVVRGSIALSATGTGTLVAGTQVDLGFASAGTIDQLYVAVGNQVQAGDLLAVLTDLEELQVQVDEKRLALETARNAVQELYQGTQVNLLQAQLTLAQAKEAMAEAQKSLRSSGVGRCSQATTESYYYDYIYAQRDVNEWETYLSDGTSGYGEDFILNKLITLRKTRDRAYTNWQYCQGYTPLEVQTSQAHMAATDANLVQAQAAYDKLVATFGLDADALALALAMEEHAALQLQIAENKLIGAEIIAPMDGTVISLSASAGEAVDTGTVIRLADLRYPNLEIYVDETDMEHLQMDRQVSVVFDAIPERTFLGRVIQVEPVLVQVNGYSMVQGLVDLNDTQTGVGRPLFLGMTAVVDVVSGQAENVLLVPVDALYDITDHQATVWVLDSNGAFAARRIEFGLMDYSYAEVVSGLTQGEVVSLEKQN
jgi:multidrug efflux pump subunit AcrA (membrane-fusion protein)